MSTRAEHTYDNMESMKFNYRRDSYYQYVEYLNQNTPTVVDFLENFPAYVGHMSLSRFLTIYELYKKTLGLAGHIADIGVYKGASSLLFAKLIKIFESESLTLCHGFDWFQGMVPTEKDSKLLSEGSYKSDYKNFIELVEKQNFSNILKIHKLNLLTDCPAFFDEHKHLAFKLVMMDAGTYDVMKTSIPFFWDRLIPGGIMIFDQFSHEFAPGETQAIKEVLPTATIRSLPNSWMPNAYIVKES